MNRKQTIKWLGFLSENNLRIIQKPTFGKLVYVDVKTLANNLGFTATDIVEIYKATGILTPQVHKALNL